MKFSASIITLASIAAGVQAQGVPSGIAPAGGSPPGCLLSPPGKYEVQNVKVAPGSKRSLVPRLVDCSNPNALIVQINNGIMTDAKGRIAEIVANRQFQFDGPPAQTGSIYTGGWSLCPNMSLAIGPTTVFYQCLSGSFYNVYDQPSGAGCIEINQQLLQCADGTAPVSVSSAPVASSSSSAAPVSSAPVVVNTTSSVAPTTASTTAPVSQATDGQPQATSPSNVSTTSAKPPVPTGGAAQFVASGAVVAIGAFAAFFL